MNASCPEFGLAEDRLAMYVGHFWAIVRLREAGYMAKLFRILFCR